MDMFWKYVWYFEYDIRTNQIRIAHVFNKWNKMEIVCKIYHRVSNYINTTCSTSGAETAYPSRAPEFIRDF